VGSAKTELDQSFFELDTKHHDMSDLVQKMDALENFFNQNEKYRLFAEFIEVYKQITESVQSIHEEDGFNQPSEMEKLDLEFAKYYFDAMQKFILDGEKIEPWKNYIDYCMREDSSESVALFLGINSHVNGDLIKALNKSDFDSNEDYTRINPVLENHLSQNLRRLILEDHDKYAFYAELFKPVTRYELNHTIISWRKQIWKHRGIKQKEPIFENYAEEVAEKIIHIAEHTNPFTLPIEAYKIKKLDLESFPQTNKKLGEV